LLSWKFQKSIKMRAFISVSCGQKIQGVRFTLPGAIIAGSCTPLAPGQCNRPRALIANTISQSIGFVNTSATDKLDHRPRALPLPLWYAKRFARVPEKLLYGYRAAMTQVLREQTVNRAWLEGIEEFGEGMTGLEGEMPDAH
jgi:hypothetical protein